MNHVVKRRLPGLLLVGCFMTATATAVANADGGGKPPEKPLLVAVKEKSKGPEAAVRLHFEVVELALSEEQIRRIDGTTEPVDIRSLYEEGVKDGSAHVRFVIDSPIILGREAKLTTANRAPFLRSVRTTKEGSEARQVEYEEIGCKLEVSAVWAGDRERSRVAVSMRLSVSDLAIESPIQVTDQVSAPMFLRADREFGTIVSLGSDTYFSSLSREKVATDKPASARVYVYRLRLDREPEQ